MQRPLWNRFATFLVWLLAAGCIVYWALKFVKGPAAPSSIAVAAPASGAGAVDALALAKGLGGGAAALQVSASDTSTPPPSALQAARFALTGVAVQKAGVGVALIAVDGKPARPYRVGSQIADGVVLHSVSAGKAALATSKEAAVALTLELPQLTTALAGTAVPSRPNLPAAASAAPAPNPMAAVANAAANAMAAPGVLGQRPPRPSANRQRESEKDVARDQAGTPQQ